ncbi:MAG: DUF6288 domain-containing protein [Planctomycetota bacterium]|jgi:hypothetical protein
MRETLVCARHPAAVTLSLLVTAFLGSPAHAVYEKEGGKYPWGAIPTNEPDKSTGGWWINLGPTGIRARIEHEDERVFVVKYVFEGSPAHGRVKVGDKIYGANGRPFATPHGFGRRSVTGYDGPMMDLGKAIEESEGDPRLEGKLTLMVRRGKEKVEAAVTLRKIGYLSPTFPFSCRKSRLLRDEALKYLVEHRKGNGWKGHGHVNSTAKLALLADRDRYLPMVKSMLPKDAGGGWTWCIGYRNILLCEYFLATGDQEVLERIKHGNDALKTVQDPDGGYHHHAYSPALKGYGMMTTPTALACIAWALMKKCGIKIHDDAYARARDFIKRGTASNGYVRYGTEGPRALGPGSGGGGHVGRTGTSLLFHYLDPQGEESAEYVKRAVRFLGEDCRSLVDGHASGAMHMFWGSIGSAIGTKIGDTESFRKMMDYNKYWFVLSRCHDGSFYMQPNRDYASSDAFHGLRFLPTASIAIILSLEKRSLQITGCDAWMPGLDRSSLSRIGQAAYDLVKQERYGDATKLLARLEKSAKTTATDREAASMMAGFIEKQADRTIAEFRRIDASGDVCLLKIEIAKARQSFRDIERFEGPVAEIEAALKEEPKKSDLRVGAEYHRMAETWRRLTAEQAAQTRPLFAKKLDRFADRKEGSVYALAAREAAKLMREPEGGGNPFTSYFQRARDAAATEGPRPEVGARVAKAASERRAGHDPDPEPLGKVVKRAFGGRRPTEKGLARFSGELRARVREELAAGRQPTYYFSKMRTKVKITALDDAGVLHVRGVRMPITLREKWDSLALADMKSIALAVLREGKPGDHAIVAFYLIATGKPKEAEPHLLLAGEDAGVLAAFE